MDISFHGKKMETLHDMPETIADGIRTPLVSQMTLEHALKYVDDIITVTDDEIAAAMKLVWSRLKIVVEPSGVASFAAINAGKVPVPGNLKAACVLSGGNVDFKKVAKLFAS